MRKIFLLLIITLLCGCERSIEITQDNKIPFRYIIHFEYKGHQYIEFRSSKASTSASGVVHDPDCKYCNKKTL